MQESGGADPVPDWWLNAWLMENNDVMDEVIATAPPNNESVRNNKDALNCDGRRTCGRHRLIRIINSPQNVGLWATSSSNTGAEWLYPLVLLSSCSFRLVLPVRSGPFEGRPEPSRKLESKNFVFCFIFDSPPELDSFPGASTLSRIGYMNSLSADEQMPQWPMAFSVIFFLIKDTAGIFISINRLLWCNYVYNIHWPLNCKSCMWCTKGSEAPTITVSR